MHIKTPLPGPKAQALLKRDAQVVSPSYPRDYPFVMSHGKGVEAWDVDGNRFLDFAAGIAVCSTGHSHPKVVQAIKDAADQFIHISSDYWHERQILLGEKINALNPIRERHRGGGRRAEIGALCDGSPALHRLPGRVPRTHDGIACFHVEQVHATEGLLSNDARRHACALPQFVSTAVCR
jgi:hypothetical protein